MRAKEVTVHDHEIAFIEGTTTGYLILHGKAQTGESVKFWVRPEQLTPYLEAYKIAGNMGHASWHIHDNHPLPCEMCHPL